jgi:hypothetical protein
MEVYNMEKFVETVPFRGIFNAKVFSSGKLIDNILEENLIVNGARLQMARLVAGEVTGRNITEIAFGTSGTNPDKSDTVITNQFVKPVLGFSYPESGNVQIGWNLLVTENNGMAIMEFGLLTADGTLFARKTRVSPIYKASDISIEGHWTIIF